jgi:hypothetical protein
LGHYIIQSTELRKKISTQTQHPDQLRLELAQEEESARFFLETSDKYYRLLYSYNRVEHFKNQVDHQLGLDMQKEYATSMSLVCEDLKYRHEQMLGDNINDTVFAGANAAFAKVMELCEG